MTRTDFVKTNSILLSTLSYFSKLTKDLGNTIVLGSVALISYTKRVGYFRKIKDIDTIVDVKYQHDIELGLIENGYSKSTFIDAKMPFAHVLKRHAETKYTRFIKGNSADLEILFTSFDRSNNRIQIELFPHVYASVPTSEFVMGELEGSIFQTVTPETLMAIKQFTQSTMGALYSKGSEKRISDGDALEKVIDVERYRCICKELKVHLFQMNIPLRKKWFIIENSNHDMKVSLCKQ
jgi:hypothetical protein